MKTVRCVVRELLQRSPDSLVVGRIVVENVSGKKKVIQCLRDGLTPRIDVNYFKSLSDDSRKQWTSMLRKWMRIF
jgi:hypothetical protein